MGFQVSLLNPTSARSANWTHKSPQRVGLNYYQITLQSGCQVLTITLPNSDKRKQVTNHPNLSKWWFYIGLSILYFQSEFGAETLILLRDICQNIMLLHWCRWTWQTHFAQLREMLFSRVASFCQSTAAIAQRGFARERFRNVIRACAFSFWKCALKPCMRQSARTAQ